MSELPRQDSIGHVDELDPANQSLAEALRKSFRVLKLIMLVLVVLYFLSGWFSVGPSERGVVLRYGRIVGAGPNNTAGDAVLGPGWHWSWPYPIERWSKVSSVERELPVRFMFQLTEEEQTGGIQGYKFGLLSPQRDDYLITGNVNILHAALLVKYRITDPVAYLTHVAPMPSPTASVRSRPYEQFPEYTVLTDLVRSAVIETAGMRADLDIRGAKQDEFVQAVASRVVGKLKSLDEAGLGLGITIDPATGIIAPKTGGVEGIMPPRQTQQAFENVDKALSGKVIAITRATSAAQSLLVKTAGPGYESILAEVEKEFDLIRKLSVARGADAAKLKKEAEAQRDVVDQRLGEAGGDARNIVKRAEIKRDQIVKEAAGDYQQFLAVLPEYEHNPRIFMTQILSEVFASALKNDQIGKIFVPESVKAYWLQIPRESMPAEEQKKAKEETPGVIQIDPRSTLGKIE